MCIRDSSKTDLGIARTYVDALVEPEHQHLYDVIVAEHQRTIEAISAVTGNAMLEDLPVLRRTLEVRDNYLDPLNVLQVNLLKEMRSSTADVTAETDEGVAARRIRRAFLLSINGVAAGLRNTG